MHGGDPGTPQTTTSEPLPPLPAGAADRAGVVDTVVAVDPPVAELGVVVVVLVPPLVVVPPAAPVPPPAGVVVVVLVVVEVAGVVAVAGTVVVDVVVELAGLLGTQIVTPLTVPILPPHGGEGELDADGPGEADAEQFEPFFTPE